MPLSFKPETIQLVLVQFRIRNPESKEKMPSEMNIQVLFEEDEKRLGVFLDFEMGDISSSTPEKYPFDLKVVYFGSFSLRGDEFQEEEIIKLGAINCAAIIFPFLREEVANLTLKAMQRPVLLPPFNFLKFYKEKRDNIKLDLIKKQHSAS
ncbi:MAG: protein-export chaperone SecB [Desulfonauticus sp.]|nr:protein-export chaperone SecB [Desulfonauticus sp.]